MSRCKAFSGPSTNSEDSHDDEAPPDVKMLSRTAVGAVAGILGGVGVAVVVTVALIVIRKPKKTP